MTGSSTTTAGRVSSSQPATAPMSSAVPSMPIFTASTAMSAAMESSWARTTSTGIGWTACTPCVFWAVIAVIAVIP